MPEPLIERLPSFQTLMEEYIRHVGASENLTISSGFDYKESYISVSAQEKDRDLAWGAINNLINMRQFPREIYEFAEVQEVKRRVLEGVDRPITLQKFCQDYLTFGVPFDLQASLGVNRIGPSEDISSLIRSIFSGRPALKNRAGEGGFRRVPSLRARFIDSGEGPAAAMCMAFPIKGKTKEGDLVALEHLSAEFKRRIFEELRDKRALGYSPLGFVSQFSEDGMPYFVVTISVLRGTEAETEHAALKTARDLATPDTLSALGLPHLKFSGSPDDAVVIAVGGH